MGIVIDCAAAVMWNQLTVYVYACQDVDLRAVFECGVLYAFTEYL
jgi:hypothetical protein